MAVGAYARQVINQDGATGVFWDVVANLMDNNTPLGFPTATADWGLLISFAVMDAVTGGNQLFNALLGDSPVLGVGLDTGDIIHSPAHGFAVDQEIVFETVEGGGALPTGITEGLAVKVVFAVLLALGIVACAGNDNEQTVNQARKQ